MKKLLFLLLMGSLAFALETGASGSAVLPPTASHYDIPAPFTRAENASLDNALRKRIIYASNDSLIWVQVRDSDTPSIHLQASGALAVSDMMPIRWCVPSENGCISPPTSACTFDKTRLSEYPGSFFYAPWCTGFIPIKLSQARSLAGEFDRVSYFSDVMRYYFQGSAPANIDIQSLASSLGETRKICTQGGQMQGCVGYYAPSSIFSASAGFSYDKAYASFNMIGNIPGDSELTVSLDGANADRYMNQAKTDIETALSSIGVPVNITFRNISRNGIQTAHDDESGSQEETKHNSSNTTYARDAGTNLPEDARYNISNPVYLEDSVSNHTEDKEEEKTNITSANYSHYAEYTRPDDKEDTEKNSSNKTSNISYAHDTEPENSNKTTVSQPAEKKENESKDTREQETQENLQPAHATYYFNAKVKTPDSAPAGFKTSDSESYATYSKDNIVVVISHPYISLWEENVSFSPDRVTATIVLESDRKETAGNALSEKARAYGVNASDWSLDYYPTGNPQYPIRYRANEEDGETQTKGQTGADEPETPDASASAQTGTSAQTTPATSASATAWQRSALGVFYNPVARVMDAISIAPKPNINTSAPMTGQKAPAAINMVASFKYLLVFLVALAAVGITLSISRKDNVILDTSSFKALSSESRLSILRSLDQKDKTLTDLANELELSLPTVKEHMDILLEAGLVVREETTRKWKYFSLTQDARRLLNNN